MSSPKIAVAGAGYLGSSIVKALQADSLDVVVLTRGTTAPKGLDAVNFKTINYDDDATLVAALEGIEVLLATVNGADMVSCQIKLANAAKKVGVKLFVTSDWGLPDVKAPESVAQHWYFHMKQAIVTHLKEIQMPYLRIANNVLGGYLYHAFLGFDFEKSQVTRVGDGTATFVVTDEDDVGRFVSHVLRTQTTDELANSLLRVQSFKTSINGAITAYEKAKGVEFKVNTMPVDEAFKLANTSENPAHAIGFLVSGMLSEGLGEFETDNKRTGFEPKVRSVEELVK